MIIIIEYYVYIYDCIVTGQVPVEIINEYFQDKGFHEYYKERSR